MELKDEEKEAKIETLRGEERCLIADLTSPNSAIGDWKEIKQLETGAYSEDEMKEYRENRAAIRVRINEIKKEIEELEK